jgi:hypothetical protein
VNGEQWTADREQGFALSAHGELRVWFGWNDKIPGNLSGQAKTKTGIWKDILRVCDQSGRKKTAEGR